jgi:2-polyprenyl-6-methoxyphenol hydroxylase-like FAD-dependent oxidoreductase
MTDIEVSVRCCIAGGGPAGMMLGYLLARAGVDVLVLEKHADFLRDFRGDTIHPSTLELFHELGLLERLLQLPHQEIGRFSAQVGPFSVPIADLGHLPTRCKFVAIMPQWDFLDFLAQEGRRYPSFRLQMQAEVTELISERGQVAGLVASTPEGRLLVRADLVVGADGRHSTVRRQAGLAVEDLGAPMDVLWTRLSRRADDPQQTLGRVDPGRILVLIERGEHWQCAFVIPKGGIDMVRERGLGWLRGELARLAPFLGDRMGEIVGWDDVKLLSVALDRLRRWCRPGLLCIGDAAHAMSPIGGVGVNLAVQDAVATANLLAGRLRQGAPALAELRAVQRRRELPTRLTQRFQAMAQRRIIGTVLARERSITRLPLLLRLLGRWRLLQRIPARVIGLGFRPEHIRSPALPPA